MHAKNLSFVNGCILSNMSIKMDKLTVPTIDFKKNTFPIFIIYIKNNGTFINNILTPIGIFNK